jgi:hypothetical protein
LNAKDSVEEQRAASQWARAGRAALFPPRHLWMRFCRVIWSWPLSRALPTATSLDAVLQGHLKLTTKQGSACRQASPHCAQQLPAEASGRLQDPGTPRPLGTGTIGNDLNSGSFILAFQLPTSFSRIWNDEENKEIQ